MSNRPHSVSVYLYVITAFLILSQTLPNSALATSEKENERIKIEAELDFACEKARAVELAPLRRNIFAECMKERNDKNFCFNDAASYDGVRQGSTPRFYDLPECVKAFEYKKQHRERY